ncbi:MAG: DUF1178 family protein [Bordetella sp.]|jgi:hypothetical protein
MKSMKIFNLQCKQGHTFEGWFASAEVCDNQHSQGLLECPLCSSLAHRIPTAAYIVSGASKSSNSSVEPNELNVMPAAATHRMQALVHQKIIEMAKSLIEQSDYVGKDFPEEARKMHYQGVPERSIVGEATAEEAKALFDEGIDLIPLPTLPRAKGTLQ